MNRSRTSTQRHRRSAWLGAVLLGLGVTLATQARALEGQAEAERLNAEVTKLFAEGRYEEASRLAERVLAIMEQQPESSDLAAALTNLGVLLDTQGDYARAEALHERALRVREKALGPDHPAVATCLNNLAGTCKARGDYGRAEVLLERAVAILEKARGAKHPDLATPLANLAVLHSARGDLAGAQRLQERALHIREEALGPDHPDVADSLSNLAIVYDAGGDHGRAEEVAERALHIREKALGPDHPDVAVSLHNLAVLYRSRGEGARAEELLLRALAIWEKALGPDHPSVATTLDALGELCDARGDLARAEPLYQRAIRIQESALGPDNPDIALTLNNLAGLYQARGENEAAEPLFKRALALWEKAHVPFSPRAATVLHNLAALYVAEGRSADAVRAEARGAAIEDRNATLMLAVGSEAQKRAYMTTLARSTAVTIAMHVDMAPSSADAARLALTTILRRKGRVLDAMAHGLAALRSHLTPADQALFDQLASVRSALGAEIFGRQGDPSGAAHPKDLATLAAARDKLEEEIGDRSAEFRAEQRLLDLTEIADAIPEGAALLELYRGDTVDFKAGRLGDPRYVAYVLRRGGDLAFTDLGPAAPIDHAVTKLRAALADPNLTHDPMPAARRLDALVMQPVRALVGQARWVLVSPDASLNLIPFEALVDERGRFLVERFAFTYLSSGRDLVRMAARAAPRQGALVIGDPDFGTFTPPVPGKPEDAARRGLRAADLARLMFPPLPSTGDEARAVATKLPGADVRLGAQATEAAIKAARAPRVLHLATHGFFLPADPAPARPPQVHPGLAPTPQEIAAAVQQENPLLRAGLALAGANARASGDRDDGILTALEASGLDLQGTRLVVLSACETGLGEAVSGEGVYGLRRALGIAGAETQVLSLWQIKSGATSDLMVAYYDKLARGAGRSEALRQAQLAMLGRAETAHPNLWAGFIVSGDWRTLEGAPATPDFSVHPGPRGCACAEANDDPRALGGGESLTALALAAAGWRRIRRRPPRG